MRKKKKVISENLTTIYGGGTTTETYATIGSGSGFSNAVCGYLSHVGDLLCHAGRGDCQIGCDYCDYCAKSPF